MAGHPSRGFWRIPKEMRRRIQKLWNQRDENGLTITGIAQRFGICTWTVRKILRKPRP